MLFNRINPKKVKKTNTQYLKSKGIIVIEHLPIIDARQKRTDKEIASRCIVMAALIQIYFEAPKDYILHYLVEHELMSHVSYEEKKYLNIDLKDLSEQDQVNLYWTIEAIWALAWVGRFHENLTFNTSVEDSLVNMLPDFESNESPEEFIRSFKSRKFSQLFTELDKFYRAHWFARNNELKGVESDLVDIDFIMERRKALEWVCDDSLPWNEVSLDT